MTQMIGFQIYRTVNIQISSKSYTVRFSVSNDNQEYALFVSNNTDCKETKYHFSKEESEDFKHYNDQKLETEVFEIIKDDMQRGRI